MRGPQLYTPLEPWQNCPAMAHSRSRSACEHGGITSQPYALPTRPHRWPGLQKPFGAVAEHGCDGSAVVGLGLDVGHGRQLADEHWQFTPHVHAPASAAQLAEHAWH